MLNWLTWAADILKFLCPSRDSPGGQCNGRIEVACSVLKDVPQSFLDSLTNEASRGRLRRYYRPPRPHWPSLRREAGSFGQRALGDARWRRHVPELWDSVGKRE